MRKDGVCLPTGIVGLVFAHLCPGALCQPIDQTGESILGQQAYRYRTTAVQICAAKVIFSSIRQHNPYLTCQDTASLGMAGDMDRSRWPLVRSLLASTSQAVWRFNSKYCLNKLGLAQTVCGNALGIFPVLCPNAPNCAGMRFRVCALAEATRWEVLADVALFAGERFPWLCQRQSVGTESPAQTCSG